MKVIDDLYSKRQSLIGEWNRFEAWENKGYPGTNAQRDNGISRARVVSTQIAEVTQQLINAGFVCN